MDPQEFMSKYGHSLQTDPETRLTDGQAKQHYIKLPITDINQLAYMQESLLEGILLLTQLEERQYKSEQIQSTIYWLCKLVLASYPHNELEGLSKWMESK